MKDRITEAPGVGKAAAKDFQTLGVSTLTDVLSLVPRAYEDRRTEKALRDTSEQDPVIYTKIWVDAKAYIPTKKGRTLKVTVSDENDDVLDLYCFNRDFLNNMLRVGDSWYITANVQRFGRHWTSAAFDLKHTKEELSIGEILPIYPLSGNLTQKQVRKAVRFALDTLPIEDELPYSFYDRLGLMHHREAYETIHWPLDPEEPDRARRTLAFTELFMMELDIARGKKARKKGKKPVETAIEKKLRNSLPFTLTDDQDKVLEEIRKDLDGPVPMNRLLQGDVGAGKTLVAWMSALHVIADGGQVAFMAPTELLAKQHAEGASSLLEPLGVRICFLTGEVKSQGRKLLLKALENGDVDLVIGTHALFSSDVKYRNLRLVIIDEQHRFGVGQREALREKGDMPNLLSMTATPIPRTLALTLFAEQDVSVIKALPSGRIPIRTFLVSEDTREKMFSSVEVEFRRGHQAYFVYPRIDDENENSDLRAVTVMYEELRERYPGVPSAMVHSRIDEDEKTGILTAFREGKLSYIVATSVVEVGIDVPKATCMVIEHAERFGLAALHQLRGRVGRSSLPSYCFLSFSPEITDEGKERLGIMRKTNDGFVIAEKDLELRGPGEITGNKQSGFLKLKFASLITDQDLIELAKTEAERVAREDRGLLLAENAVLRRRSLESGN